VASVLAERIAETRKRKGLKQTELAKEIDVSVDSVRRWEQDKRAPRTNELEKIADVLETTVGYLLGSNEKAYAVEDDPGPPGGQSTPQNIQDDFESDDPLRVASKKLLDSMTPEQLRKSYEYLSDQKRLRELEELKGA
jgi:transcriptional regulator with XRE-family HTH domain